MLPLVEKLQAAVESRMSLHDFDHYPASVGNPLAPLTGNRYPKGIRALIVEQGGCRQTLLKRWRFRNAQACLVLARLAAASEDLLRQRARDERR